MALVFVGCIEYICYSIIVLVFTITPVTVTEGAKLWKSAGYQYTESGFLLLKWRFLLI